MSYILDALKKSEEERQRGTGPDVIAARDFSAPEPKARLHWPYVALTALILSATLLFLWFAPWRSKGMRAEPQRLTAGNEAKPAEQTADTTHTTPPASIQGSTVDNRATQPATAPEAPSPGARLAGKQDTDRSVKQEEAAQQDRRQQSQTAEKKTVPIEKARTMQDTSPSVQQSAGGSPAGPQIASKAATTPGRKTHTPPEFPSSIKKDFPDFSISVLFYSSDADSRMIRINGKTLREGQELVAGLRLEEINENSAVFSYENRRFRVGVQ